MITLGTGLPGNGKTLFMLWYIKAKADRERREVYYHNVKDLNAEKVGNWLDFDPTKWMDLPHGSIILIDECQEVFPKKPNGAQLPAFYEELAKHRHKGFDIFLITQHPTLIDNFVRRLVGQHFHSIRKFGLARATVYEWSACSPSPELPSSQKTAIPMKWKFPAEVFSWYKSAEVHTVKRAIPAKLVLGVLFVVAVPVVGYLMLQAFQERHTVEPVHARGNAPGSVANPFGQAAGVGPVSVPFDAVADARQYVEMRTPRVAGLPHTAPVYDTLTTPVRVPVPAACVVVPSKRSCKCYSQQATPMAVEFNMCVEFARNGYFQDFDADRDRQQDQRAATGAQVLADRPDVSIRPDIAGPRVLALADVPVSGGGGIRPAPNLDDGPPRERPSRTVIAE